MNPNLSQAIPVLTGMAVKALRPYLAALDRWNTAYQPGPDFRGLTYHIPKPDPNIAVRTVTPGVTPVQAPAVTPSRTTVTFDDQDWLEAPIHLTDFEQTTVVTNFWQAQVDAAVQSLMRDLEQRFITEMITEPANAVTRWDAGTGSNTPPDTLFGEKVSGVGPKARPLPLQPITHASERLTVAEAPVDMRCMIVNEGTYYGLQSMEEWNRVDYSGSTAEPIQRMGMLGNKLGWEWALTGGTRVKAASGTANNKLVNGTPAIGDTDIPIDGPAGTFLAGDVVTFGNHNYSYVVAEDVAGGGNTLKLRTGLVRAVPDNAVITIASRDKRLGIAFQKNFAILATKVIPARPGESMNTQMGPLRIRVVNQRQSDQDQLKIQVAYAMAAHYRGHACILVLE